jgi:hypothetical protein
MPTSLWPSPWPDTWPDLLHPWKQMEPWRRRGRSHATTNSRYLHTDQNSRCPRIHALEVSTRSSRFRCQRSQLLYSEGHRWRC